MRGRVTKECMEMSVGWPSTRALVCEALAGLEGSQDRRGEEEELV